MKWLVVVGVLAIASPVFAQDTYQLLMRGNLFQQFGLTNLRTGMSEWVAIDVDDVPGDELAAMIKVEAESALYILVPFARRSGLNGVNPSPGACLEKVLTLSTRWQDFNELVVFDHDADGRKDLVATTFYGTYDVIQPKPLRFCGR